MTNKSTQTQQAPQRATTDPLFDAVSSEDFGRIVQQLIDGTKFQGDQLELALEVKRIAVQLECGRLFITGALTQEEK